MSAHQLAVLHFWIFGVVAMVDRTATTNGRRTEPKMREMV